MPVGNEEIAIVLLLQLNPVLQHSKIMPEVKWSGGPHAGNNAMNRGHG
jgi:hypothetical protein